MRIEVTAEDIVAGRSHSDKCPIALAAKRAGLVTPWVSDDVRTAEWSIRFGRWDNRQRAMLPKEAAAFAMAFDKCHDGVEPFSFDLDVSP